MGDGRGGRGFGERMKTHKQGSDVPSASFGSYTVTPFAVFVVKHVEMSLVKVSLRLFSVVNGMKWFDRQFVCFFSRVSCV